MAEYIDRESAISLIKQYGMDAIDGGRYSLDAVGDCIELENGIKALPAADVVPVVHGRWEQCFEDWRKQIEGDKCSACGFEHYGTSIDHYHYCPNCGAKMDKKEATHD